MDNHPLVTCELRAEFERSIQSIREKRIIGTRYEKLRNREFEPGGYIRVLLSRRETICSRTVFSSRPYEIINCFSGATDVTRDRRDKRHDQLAHLQPFFLLKATWIARAPPRTSGTFPVRDDLRRYAIARERVGSRE